MMDREELDFSALDPAREPERWQAFVERTRARVNAAIDARAGLPREMYDDPVAVIESWARPLLAAAAIAAAVLIPAVWATTDPGQANVPSVPRERALAAYTLEWVDTGKEPTPAELAAAVERPAMESGGVQ